MRGSSPTHNHFTSAAITNAEPPQVTRQQPNGSGNGAEAANGEERSAENRDQRDGEDPDQKKQTLTKLPATTQTALSKETAKVRRGKAPTRAELQAEARRLNIKGRSKMGKAELARAIARTRR